MLYMSIERPANRSRGRDCNMWRGENTVVKTLRSDFALRRVGPYTMSSCCVKLPCSEMMLGLEPIGLTNSRRYTRDTPNNINAIMKLVSNLVNRPAMNGLRDIPNM